MELGQRSRSHDKHSCYMLNRINKIKSESIERQIDINSINKRALQLIRELSN